MELFLPFDRDMIYLSQKNECFSRKANFVLILHNDLFVGKWQWCWTGASGVQVNEMCTYDNGNMSWVKQMCYILLGYPQLEIVVKIKNMLEGCPDFRRGVQF